MDRITLRPDGIDALMRDEDVAKQLEPAAQRILSRARPKFPSWVQADFYTRAGVSRKGAFAQAVARGSGTVLAEYGGRRSPAYAPFRSSL